MIWLLLALATLPETVRVSTPRGTTSIPISHERGASVAAPLLAEVLGLAVVLEGSRAVVVVDGAGFVFALDSPFARIGSETCQLVDEAYVARDTLFLPLVWLTDCLPRVFGSRFEWDPGAGLLTERAPPGGTVAVSPSTVGDSTPGQTASSIPAPGPPTAPDPPPAVSSTEAPTVRVVHSVEAGPVANPVVVRAKPNPITGLRLKHAVVIDPGHGGVDPGNTSRRYFPAGVYEKDINLSIAKLLRAELTQRGITATLTRTTDTLIALRDRPTFCRADCDLFVSIHVNSMGSGSRSQTANGVETYFLSAARTDDQRRVLEMEDDAIRFETPAARAAEGDVANILADLQQNEYMRESATLAQAIQARVATSVPGDDRGVQQAPFLVLRAARRPAVLVETGFSTNKRDGTFLASTLGQRKVARAIADGVVAYLREFEHKLAVGSGP
jgi:N-acetylmuramoyl-L-alanine amidase